MAQFRNNTLYLSSYKEVNKYLKQYRCKTFTELYKFLMDRYNINVTFS